MREFLFMMTQIVRVLAGGLFLLSLFVIPVTVMFVM